MRFINAFQSPSTIQQLAINDRDLVAALNDGLHDINLNSATIGSAYISNLVVGSGLFSAANIDYTRLSGTTLYAASGNMDYASILSATITTMSLGYSPRISAASIIGASGNFAYGSIASAAITTANITSATIGSATITGAKIGTLQGLILGTSGIIGAVASGTTAQYLRGDVSMQTLNASAVGLTNVTNNTQVIAVASTDNAVARYNGTAGQVQNSGVLIDDSDNVTATSVTAAIESKSVDVMYLTNHALANNDTDTIVFDFVPSKIVLDVAGIVYHSQTDEPGIGKGLSLITVTGTDTITSTNNAYSFTANTGTTHDVFRSTNSNGTTYMYGGTNVTAAYMGYSFTWTTSTKTLTITYVVTNTHDNVNDITFIATAYK